MRIISRVAGIVAIAAAGFALEVAAEDSYGLTIKNHKFIPDTLEIPANARVKLVVKNEDATPEEFDSDNLHREKVVPAGAEAIIFIGPLKPGTYEFKGEYHEDTAKGRVVAK
jgi:cupredoxin-like protein